MVQFIPTILTSVRKVSFTSPSHSLIPHPISAPVNEGTTMRWSYNRPGEKIIKKMTLRVTYDISFAMDGPTPLIVDV